MSDTQHRNEFGFAVSSLAFDGARFLGALDHSQYGPQIAPFLPANFRDDYARTLAELSQAAADQSTASGAIHLATAAQTEARAEVMLLAGLARESARSRFRDNAPLLHDEFLVAQHVPNDLASIGHRAGLLIAACTTHAAELEPHGWAPRQTAALAAAVHALNQARLEVSFASDAREGFTAAKLHAANRLYRQSRVIQRAARAVFTAKRAQRDDNVLEARGLFLLGEFPKRNRAGNRVASATPVAPTDAAPTDNAPLPPAPVAWPGPVEPTDTAAPVSPASTAAFMTNVSPAHDETSRGGTSDTPGPRDTS